MARRCVAHIRQPYVVQYGGYSSAECLERFGFVDALPDRPASEGDDLAALCAVSPTLTRAPEPPA